MLDGCGEFMPAGDDGTPAAIKCAACDCHRNFHRREAAGGETSATIAPPFLSPPPPPPSTANCYISFNHSKPQKHPILRPTLNPNHHHHHRRRTKAEMVAFGESSSDDLNAGNFSPAPAKKRFRTKLTAEMKEKMADFAERIGWRIQKQNESEVQRICEEVGINRQVFKVWLHNNKQAMKKKQS